MHYYFAQEIPLCVIVCESFSYQRCGCDAAHHSADAVGVCNTHAPVAFRHSYFAKFPYVSAGVCMWFLYLLESLYAVSFTGSVLFVWHVWLIF